jgi:nitrile hydratase accessory protein
MSTATQTHFIHEMRDEGAPPRRNGELVFDEPWEGRAFGMAIALSEKGYYPWEEFRSRLIQTIGQWEHEHAADLAEQEIDPHDPAHCGHPEWSYYGQWLATFESLLLDRGMVGKEELDRRTQEFMTTRRDEAF